ncbi:uncharacterized protein LACBIDRAFT_312517 [Laccaria bicolor S238N-H82]|uniref:U3 small nucleolar RNA-associated protein 22 n=1 Tax=Laccaria bicolor (strain S238N-H82 / ATCC MYA-4686) TaxID=486041 RepID=B0DWB9_LACBS|nr:uncharacterized protein LACBIDRAFT_312517 [Laccaria bicolor S238N-H82]EDR01199.1 predicted protein [Laccaria bicolor S238N-H82]|eukprot:XP_001888241.1 predicted protein [Laccaria bicolor S238N-H82]
METSKTLKILNETTITRDPSTQVFLKDNRDLSTRFHIVLRTHLQPPQSFTLHLLRDQYLKHPFVPDVIVIGLVLDPQTACRLADHGPAADDEDQVALDNFPERLFNKFLSATLASRKTHSKPGSPLSTQFSDSTVPFQASTGVSTGFKGAMTAFDNLVKAIKALDNELPLTLSTVSPTSEPLRYTSVFSPVPLPASLATSLPPNNSLSHSH